MPQDLANCTLGARPFEFKPPLELHDPLLPTTANPPLPTVVRELAGACLVTVAACIPGIAALFAGPAASAVPAGLTGAGRRAMLRAGRARAAHPQDRRAAGKDRR